MYVAFKSGRESYTACDKICGFLAAAWSGTDISGEIRYTEHQNHCEYKLEYRSFTIFGICA